MTVATARKLTPSCWRIRCQSSSSMPLRYRNSPAHTPSNILHLPHLVRDFAVSPAASKQSQHVVEQKTKDVTNKTREGGTCLFHNAWFCVEEHRSRHRAFLGLTEEGRQRAEQFWRRGALSITLFHALRHSIEEVCSKLISALSNLNYDSLPRHPQTLTIRAGSPHNACQVQPALTSFWSAEAA